MGNVQSDKTIKDLVSEWLDQAKWAASGGNSQPWRVTVTGDRDKFQVILTIDWSYRDHRHSPMDVDGRASAMALGALQMNLKVVAAWSGYGCENVLIKEGRDFWHSAIHLHFQKQKARPSVYFSVQDLFRRRTNRSHYKQEPLSETTKKLLSEFTRKQSGKCQLIDLSDRREELVEVSKGLEKIRWTDNTYLESLLDEIAFGSDDDFGIPVDQLGVGALDQQLMRLNKSVPALRSLFRWGGYKMATQQNLVRPLKESGGVYYLAGSGNSFSDHVAFGELYQEIWTFLNTKGYGFQPISHSFVAQGLLKHDQPSPESKRACEDFQNFFENSLGQSMDAPLLGFRTGLPKTEADKSRRQSVSFFVVENEKSEVAVKAQA